MLTRSHLHKLFMCRSLIIRLSWSDFKLRYKNSFLGFLWSLLEPLLMLLVLYVVFSYIMRLKVDHYQLFLLLGIVLWNFLDRGTSLSIVSIIGKPSLVQKVYFPRDILIISSCITALMMTALELVVFMIFLLAFRLNPGVTAIYFPILFFFEFMIILGLSLALSSLNVYYRDVQFIWRLILQLGFFATPVIYPMTVIPGNMQRFLLLNPIARILSLARDCTLYQTAPGLDDIAYVAASAIFIFIAGYFIFDRLEPDFAEAI